MTCINAMNEYKECYCQHCKVCGNLTQTQELFITENDYHDNLIMTSETNKLMRTTNVYMYLHFRDFISQISEDIYCDSVCLCQRSRMIFLF